MNKRPKDFVAGILVFGQLDGRREQFPASVVDAVADADAVFDAGFGGCFLRLSRSLSTPEVPPVEVDEDHDEAAEDDEGRAEVVARSAAVARVDVACNNEYIDFVVVCSGLRCTAFARSLALAIVFDLYYPQTKQ